MGLNNFYCNCILYLLHMHTYIFCTFIFLHRLGLCRSIFFYPVTYTALSAELKSLEPVWLWIAISLLGLNWALAKNMFLHLWNLLWWYTLDILSKPQTHSASIRIPNCNLSLVTFPLILASHITSLLNSPHAPFYELIFLNVLLSLAEPSTPIFFQDL